MAIENHSFSSNTGNGTISISGTNVNLTGLTQTGSSQQVVVGNNVFTVTRNEAGHLDIAHTGVQQTVNAQPQATLNEKKGSIQKGTTIFNGQQADVTYDATTGKGVMNLEGKDYKFTAQLGESTVANIGGQQVIITSNGSSLKFMPINTIAQPTEAQLQMTAFKTEQTRLASSIAKDISLNLMPRKAGEQLLGLLLSGTITLSQARSVQIFLIEMNKVSSGVTESGLNGYFEEFNDFTKSEYENNPHIQAISRQPEILKDVKDVLGRMRSRSFISQDVLDQVKGLISAASGSRVKSQARLAEGAATAATTFGLDQAQQAIQNYYRSMMLSPEASKLSATPKVILIDKSVVDASDANRESYQKLLQLQNEINGKEGKPLIIVQEFSNRSDAEKFVHDLAQRYDAAQIRLNTTVVIDTLNMNQFKERDWAKVVAVSRGQNISFNQILALAVSDNVSFLASRDKELLKGNHSGARKSLELTSVTDDNSTVVNVDKQIEEALLSEVQY